jgi:hypothetical protein
MTRALLGLSMSAASLALLCASSAVAEPTAGQRAAAEALFEQGSQLVDAGRVAEACEKFAASQELDPGLGTLLHLADCYDRAGRTASAWALFREVQERSRRAAQQDREQIALERANALEAKLSRLELRVPAGREHSGLTLSLGGAVVPKASWNVAIPVDPGPVRIEARAPGKQPWSLAITLAAGPSKRVVELPELKQEPKTAQPVNMAAKRNEAAPSSAQRTWGFVTGGVGLAALAVGGVFGYRAYSLDKSSKAECRADQPNACTPEGASLREQASAAARLSTVATISGALLTLGGVTLVLSAPSSTTTGRDATARAQYTDSDWRVGLRGVW